MVDKAYINVGIIGAAGYTAGELLRILVNHPRAHVVFAQSSSHAGEPVWSAHPDLIGETDLRFTDIRFTDLCSSDLCSSDRDCASGESILASLRLSTPCAQSPVGDVPPSSQPLIHHGPGTPCAQSPVGDVPPSSQPLIHHGPGTPCAQSPVGGTVASQGGDTTASQAGKGIDVLFLCSGHGKSKDFVHSLPEGYQGAIIDLSNDFRLAADAEDFVYGLPEAFRSRIAGAKHIANPGCFATGIQLAILPMAAADRLTEIHVTGITGSTGAGQAPSATTHFSWRSDNVSVYKAFTHQHLGEVCETLRTLAPSWQGEINFVPLRGDFARGILVSVYFDCDLGEEEAVKLYKDYYQDEPFVHVTEENPDMKMVVNTNKCVLHVRKYGRKLHVVSVIDNLVKGASGQAVQNMNILFGLPEDTGLHLKGTRF